MKFSYSWLSVPVEGKYVDVGFVLKSASGLKWVPSPGFENLDPVPRVIELGAWDYYLDRAAGGMSSSSEPRQVEAPSAEAAITKVFAKADTVQHREA